MIFDTMDLNKDCMLDQSDVDLIKDNFGSLFNVTEREVRPHASPKKNKRNKKKIKLKTSIKEKKSIEKVVNSILLCLILSFN